MSLKNLSASNKTHKFFLNKLKNKDISKIYKQFEKELDLEDDFIVAVSGGSDSLALSFLSKLYSIKKSVRAKYFIVDHKLRKNSEYEARFVKKLLKKNYINLNILKWVGRKPTSNIQSIARENRYKLLIEEAKKLKIKNILLGHHKDDLYENFFIRILRGSGLNGLVSFDKITTNKKVNLLRPLLKFEKKDLINITVEVFGEFVEDPSNNYDKFKRVRIRKLIENLKLEGFDSEKFYLTIKNLKFANNSIKFFVEKNLTVNTTFLEKKNLIILNKDFFLQPEEIVFRSLTQVIKIIGKRYYPVRGKKIENIVNLIKIKTSFKITLGNCVLKKVNNTLIVSKEQ